MPGSPGHPCNRPPRPFGSQCRFDFATRAKQGRVCRGRFPQANRLTIHILAAIADTKKNEFRSDQGGVSRRQCAREKVLRQHNGQIAYSYQACSRRKSSRARSARRSPGDGTCARATGDIDAKSVAITIPSDVVCSVLPVGPDRSGRTDRDGWGGQDRRDKTRLFRAGSVDQGDRADAFCVARDGSQGHSGEYLPRQIANEPFEIVDAQEGSADGRLAKLDCDLASGGGVARIVFVRDGASPRPGRRYRHHFIATFPNESRPCARGRPRIASSRRRGASR